MSICVTCVGWINLAQVGDPVFPDGQCHVTRYVFSKIQQGRVLGVECMTLDDNERIVSPTGLEDVLMYSGRRGNVVDLILDSARWVYGSLPYRNNATEIIGWV